MAANENIKKALETLGIPVAYRQFTPYKDKPVPAPPYIVYIISPENARGADGKNLVTKKHVTVELYTDIKDEILEQRVEDLLNMTEWSKYEDYIESEVLYMVSWEFDIYEKIRR